MYRTEQWYEDTKDNRLKTPLCILSYKRPDAPIFSKLSEFNKDEVFVFIRDDEEQKQAYKEIGERFTIVHLPKSVDEVGTTREAINQWAMTKGYTNIFVFDDRITKVNFLSPKTSKTGKLSLVANPNSSLYTALLIWERILELKPFTMSCPAHSGFSYFPENIDKEFTPNNGNVAACISINVKDFQKYNIRYDSTKNIGYEDADIVLKVLEAGLPVCKITDLEYDEVTSDNITSGGNHEDNKSLLKRCVDKNELFWTKCLKLNVGDKHQGVYLRKQSGGIYPYFKWAYWQTYYQNHKTKNV